MLKMCKTRPSMTSRFKFVLFFSQLGDGELEMLFYGKLLSDGLCV